jgi:hypothetical protein
MPSALVYLKGRQDGPPRSRSRDGDLGRALRPHRRPGARSTTIANTSRRRSLRWWPWSSDCESSTFRRLRVRSTRVWRACSSRRADHTAAPLLPGGTLHGRESEDRAVHHVGRAHARARSPPPEALAHRRGRPRRDHLSGPGPAATCSASPRGTARRTGPSERARVTLPAAPARDVRSHGRGAQRWRERRTSVLPRSGSISRRCSPAASEGCVPDQSSRCR